MACAQKWAKFGLNEDDWFLARDHDTGAAFVRYQANAASGALVTDIELVEFLLSGERYPEQDALLRVIGSLIPYPQGASAEDDRQAVDTGREWSDAELKELGDMLLGGLSIEEIARLLRRDNGEVRDKVAEAGRACR